MLPYRAPIGAAFAAFLLSLNLASGQGDGVYCRSTDFLSTVNALEDQAERLKTREAMQIHVLRTIPQQRQGALSSEIAKLQVSSASARNSRTTASLSPRSIRQRLATFSLYRRVAPVPALRDVRQELGYLQAYRDQRVEVATWLRGLKRECPVAILAMNDGKKGQ